MRPLKKRTLLFRLLLAFSFLLYTMSFSVYKYYMLHDSVNVENRIECWSEFIYCKL